MTLFQSLASALHIQSALTTRTTSIFSVDISMVIDFPLSVDLAVVRGFIAVCLHLDGSSSVFSAHEMQLLSSTGDVNAALQHWHADTELTAILTSSLLCFQGQSFQKRKGSFKLLQSFPTALTQLGRLFSGSLTFTTSIFHL